ncbi:ThiF family adenylyltransferase [Kitasatospora sp. NPDC052896]|uniref:ThiF family adenylyltransferase n=1 Tax=Kitasatospora sp. NPDC052896 TaxID=3364061 RepID=UPI0037C6A1B3
MLKTALSRAWRDPEVLQFGTAPERAQLASPADARFCAFLDLLDGRRDAAAVVAAGAGLGLDPEYVEQTLRSLTEAGLMDDSAVAEAELAGLTRTRRELLGPDLASLSLLYPAPGEGARVLRRRSAVQVEVRGAGRVGAALAGLLAAAGVGAVVVVDRGRVEAGDCAPGGIPFQDIGRLRGTAAREAVGRAAGVAAPAREAVRAGPPDLVVLAPRDGSGAFAGDAPQARELIRAGVPHLYVGVVEHLGVVGPLVLPGASACGGCVALARTDRDSAWPRLLAQLAAEGPGRPRAPACDGAVAASVAGLASLHLLLHLDGERPPSVDGWCEISAADGMVRRLRLPPHTDCGCFWREGRW